MCLLGFFLGGSKVLSSDHIDFVKACGALATLVAPTKSAAKASLVALREVVGTEEVWTPT
jgi:hypothetical protein